MQVPTTVTNPLSAPASQAVGRGLPWRAGAILQAVVLDVSAPGRVELQIGNQTLSARALFPLSEGQVLSLRVTHTGELVVMSAEPDPSERAAPRMQDALLAQQALREALPRQAPLPPLLANLALVARQPQRFPPPLVDAARATLALIPEAADVVEAEALARHVQRSGLWLEASLAGFDAAMPDDAPLSGDWKAALLRLAAGLRALATSPALPGNSTPAHELPTTARAAQAPAQSAASPAGSPAPAEQAQTAADPARAAPADPRAAAHERGAAPASPQPSGTPASALETAPLLRTSAPQPQARSPASLEQLVFAADDSVVPARHLLKQVEGALARVELGQLASLPADEPSGATWQLELPLRAPDGEADVLQLRIEREAAASGAEVESVWAVTLAFDLGDLGPVRARVAVRGETVSTLFFAERAATVARVRDELGGLESALVGRGLKVGAVGCRAGAPEQAPSPDAPQDAAPLLEVRA